MLHSKLTRRRFLGLSAVGATALALPGAGCAHRIAAPDFTAAFFTDMHVEGKREAPTGFRRSIEHALNHSHRPELLITGGDLVYDILGTDVATADAQYDLFEDALAASAAGLPVHHIIGNHDVLGVYDESGLKPDHELYGKEYFRRRFGREKTYSSFDHKGWHFVLLDTVGIDGRSYRGWIDEEQLAWLEADLAAANKPTVVAGHIPLFSSLPEWQEGIETPDHPKAVVGNAPAVAEILHSHPVKLVLAGHLHVNESWLFKGIEFANVGAVSGRWWRGPRLGFEEGYAMLEFHEDTVSWRYIDYGWEARLLPEDRLETAG